MIFVDTVDLNVVSWNNAYIYCINNNKEIEIIPILTEKTQEMMLMKKARVIVSLRTIL